MNITSKATRHIVALTMALLGSLAIVGSARAEHDAATRLGLTKPSDFTPLARQGFLEHAANAIDPATGDPILVLDPLGSRMNGDTWSMHWLDLPGAPPASLFVGTNRNPGCFTDPDAPENATTCPVPGPLGLPLLDQDDRAEIWRFTPDGFNHGRTGTWTRVHQSPMSFVLTFLMPRHTGYRSMIPCNAGGPERLYVSAGGPHAEIISTNGNSVYPGGPLFQRASTVGLNTLAVSGIDADIGYGRIQCHTGPDNVVRVIMSPVGSLTNNDAPLPGRAVILANSNPSNTSSPWLTVSNSGFGNPNNVSVFNMKVFKNALNGFNYLYFGVMNNTTGAEIWRTAGCTVPPPGCGATYEKVLEFGGGRNELHPEAGVDDGGAPIANSTVAIDMETLDVNGDGHDDYLYVGIGHIATGDDDFVRPELIRFSANDPLPDRGKKWVLVAGKPRLPSDFPILNFNCSNHIPDGVGGSLTPDPDICFPLSGRGAGLGDKLGAIGPCSSIPNADAPFSPGFSCSDVVSPNIPNTTYAYFRGPNAYIWNDEQCDTNGDGLKELYFGTLDRGGGNFSSVPRAADLWRTVDGSNGERLQLVDTTGFGNRNNGGIRGMACTPFGLAVGTSNRRTNVASPPFPPGQTGGTEVHLGACAPDGPLVADARVVTKSSQPNEVVFDGLKYIAYDDENYPAAGDGFVTNVKLDGSNSANRFCGHPIATYEWHTGDLVGSCADLDSGDASFLASTDIHTIASLATSITPYPFTLKVTSTNASNLPVIACDKVDVLASANQRPKATITVPGIPPATPGGTDRKRLQLVDLDASGSESVDIVGNCTDPEDGTGPPLSCEWSNPLPGTTLTNTACTTPTTDCQTTATVVSGFRGLDTLLTATDFNGNKHVYTLNISVRATRHDVAVTDVTLPSPPAAENVAETVDVTVENEGDFTETNFTVTLADSAGGTIVPPSFTVPSLAAGASTTLNFIWTPTSGGNITLTATAATVPQETDTGDNTKSILVAVTNVNDPPDAVNDTASTPEGTQVVKNVLANDTDPDGDTLTVTAPLVSTPTTQGGTVICTGAGLCTYTPPPAFTGTDTFTYTACDTGVPVLCDPAPATVTVTVTVIPPTTPTPPTGVTVTDTGPLTVQVTWTDGSFETRYEIRRCRVFFGACIGITILTTTLPANTTVFNSTVPQAGTWRYLVRGCNGPTNVCSTQAQGQAPVN